MRCVKCNSLLPDGSNFCHFCGSSLVSEKQPDQQPAFYHVPPVPSGQKSSATGNIALIVTVIVAVLSLLLNAVLFFNNKELDEQVAEMKSTVASVEKELASSQKKAQYYDDILSALRTGSIGRASNSFSASDSVILVNKRTTDRKFTLYTKWNQGATISVDQIGTSATVSFDNNTWYDSTTLTVIPKEEGISAITFSNDLNSDTFTVMIIVVS